MIERRFPGLKGVKQIKQINGYHDYPENLRSIIRLNLLHQLFRTLQLLKIETNLVHLAQAELEKEEENFCFKEVLYNRDPQHIDTLVKALNAEIAPQINCTDCGNCCKSLMVNITQPEVERLSGYLNMPVPDLKEKYVETSLQGDMILNTIPCHFLKGTSCSIYEHRFTECRDFPALHRDGFVQRAFSTFMHYGRCPIIYNVIERLKIDTGFIIPTAS